MTTGLTTSRSVPAMVASGSTPIGKITWMTLRFSSMMTTVRAASSATLSVALAPRKAAEVPPRVVHREVAAQEAALRVAAAHVEAVIPQESRTVAVVAPVVMTTTIITHRAAVAEAVGDSFCHKTDKTSKTLFQHIGRATAPVGCFPSLTIRLFCRF